MRSGEANLQCIIRNCGLIWADIQDSQGRPVGRWLAALELLASQGFPTMDWQWGHRDSSFSRPRARNRAAVYHQAGNTMSLP
eukprot:9501165-Pyramimonas_sp.AAC.1